MNKILLKPLFLILGIPSVFAEDNNYPPTGSYGFDWLNPLTAQCQQIADVDMNRFESCYFESEGGSFGLDFPYYSCRVSEDIEYVIYLSESACIEAKETMDAHTL